MIKTVKKGGDAFKPTTAFLDIQRNDGITGYWITFDKSCEYTLPGEEQEDWNKLFGKSFNLLTNHKNSIMVGWRWNPNLQVMELNAYAHVDGKRVMSEPIFRTHTGKEFAAWIEINYVTKEATVAFYDEEAVYKTVVKFSTMNTVTRAIGPWFGGTSKAPQDMVIGMNRIIYFGQVTGSDHILPYKVAP